MALNDEYLPGAQNQLPKYIQDVLAGAPAAPVSPAGSRMDIPVQPPMQDGLDPYIQSLLATEEPDVEVDQETGLIVPSVKRGAAMTFASLANLVGAEETATEATEWAAQFPKQIETVQDVKSLSDLGTFAVESAAENLASLLAIAGGAVLGTVALPTAGVLGVSGAVIGGGTANFLLQAGESKMAVEAEGGDPNLVNVGAPAIVNTAIDTFSIMKIAQKAGILSKVVSKLDEAAEVSGLGGRIAHGVKTGAQAFAMEGSTEVIQNYNNMVAAKLSTDKTIREALALQGQDVDELINAFAAGGLGAAVTSAPLATAFGGTPKSREALAVDSESADQGSRAAPVQPTEVDPNPIAGEPAQKVATPTDKPTDAPAVGDPTFTQDKGDESQPAVEADSDAVVLEMQAEIDSRVAFLETGEVGGYTPEGVRGLPARGEALLSTADTPDVDQPMPSRHWETPTYTRDNQESSVFSTITADTPDTVVTGEFRNNFAMEDQYAITDYVETLRKELLPDSSVILGGPQDFFETGESTMAAAANVNIEGRMAHILQFNPEGVTRISEAMETDNKALLMETVAHEFGHAVSADRFRNETPETKSAVYREYQSWLERQSKASMREFVKDRFPAASGKYYLSQIPSEVLDMPLKEARKMIGWTAKDFRYHLSFEEYTADNMAKYVSRDASLQNQISKETKGYWSKAIDVFREIWNTLGKFMPQAKFKAWVEKMRKQRALDALLRVPLASESIHAELSEFVDLDINKLRDNLKYKMSDGVRTIETAGTILNDTQQIEALRRNYRVSTGFTRKVAGRFLTPAQIAERYNIPQAKAYMERVYEYYQTKMRGISEADAVSKQWMDLPEAQADNFGKFLFEVSQQSDTLGRRLNPTELGEVRDKYNLDDSMMSLYNEVDGSFRGILERLERSIIKDIARGYVETPDAFVNEFMQATSPVERVLTVTSFGVEDYTNFVNELTRVQKQFQDLRNKNYFPRMRFGDYTIVVKRRYMTEKGEYRETTEEFLTFESKKERDKMLEQYFGDFAYEIKSGTVDVIGSKLDDTTRSLYGMPQLVVDRIANTLRDAEGEGLTTDQERAIADISLDLSPGKRYLRHMQRRKNTKGFSTEAMRSYAAYMANASNHLARVEHTQDMTTALRELRGAQKGMAGDVTDLAELDSYYTEHFRYLMNPENDWAKLRAFGFLWYLGANPKSALVNTTQLPMVTYPFLASRYGDKGTITQMTKALKDVASHFVAKKRYTEEEQRLMDKLLQEGVIDESMASDLAGISEGTALQRLLPTNKAHRVMNNINYYGGYLFSIAEKFNRQVTALAAFRLHMEKTKSKGQYETYREPVLAEGKTTPFREFEGLDFITEGSIAASGAKIEGVTITVKNKAGEEIAAFETEKVDGRTLQVFNTAIVDESLKGIGLGKEGYTRLMFEAYQQGYRTLQSDKSVSEDAARVWESFGATRNKEATLEEGYEWKKWDTPDDSPVFEVNIRDVLESRGYRLEESYEYVAKKRKAPDSPGDFNASYKAAKDAIHKSQFEYAKYNRPEFMRGKKSAFFLFYNYTQQFMYMAFAGGGTKADKGTAVRMWGMLLLLAGIQGLPFAEYVLSTLDIFGSKAKQFFGMENPRVNIRQDLRELFDDLGVNPDLMMHGTGRYLGAGPLKLLEMFGAPVPNLDITGSLGMGEPLPGLRTNDLKGDPEEMAGQLLLNGLGPIPNIGLGMWNSVSSSDPDTWKNFEKALPVALKNVSKATRFSVREMETSRGGAEFLPYDGHNPYHMGEIVAQALGFSSTRLAQKREMYGEQIQSSMYWATRRSLLLERYAYASKTKDKEARKEALAAIHRFNASLTAPELKPYKISGPSMARSLKTKMRVLKRREMGIPTTDRDRLLYNDIEKLYTPE